MGLLWVRILRLRFRRVLFLRSPWWVSTRKWTIQVRYWRSCLISVHYCQPRSFAGLRGCWFCESGIPIDNEHRLYPSVPTCERHQHRLWPNRLPYGNLHRYVSLYPRDMIAYYTNYIWPLATWKLTPIPTWLRGLTISNNHSPRTNWSTHAEHFPIYTIPFCNFSCRNDDGRPTLVLSFAPLFM